MSKLSKIIDLKLSLYHLLNEMDKRNQDLSDTNSELLFVLENDPDLESELEQE